MLRIEQRRLIAPLFIHRPVTVLRQAATEKMNTINFFQKVALILDEKFHIHLTS
jgi:hypothetical protein